MANIRGIEIRNLITNDTQHGILYEGDVFLNGNELGHWKQKSWFDSEYGFDYKKLNAELSRFVSSIPDDVTLMGNKMKYMFTTEKLLMELAILTDIQERYDIFKDSETDKLLCVYMEDGIASIPIKEDNEIARRKLWNATACNKEKMFVIEDDDFFDVQKFSDVPFYTD